MCSGAPFTVEKISPRAGSNSSKASSKPTELRGLLCEKGNATLSFLFWLSVSNRSQLSKCVRGAGVGWSRDGCRSPRNIFFIKKDQFLEKGLSCSRRHTETYEIYLLL